MLCLRHKFLCVKIDNDWYDLTKLKKVHPGGSKILKKYNKKDATTRFYSVYGHQNFIHLLKEYLITDTNLITNLNKNLKKSK